jgi:hypothetical protein
MQPTYLYLHTKKIFFAILDANTCMYTSDAHTFSDPYAYTVQKERTLVYTQRTQMDKNVHWDIHSVHRKSWRNVSKFLIYILMFYFHLKYVPSDLHTSIYLSK